MITIRKIVYFFCATCRPHRSATVRYAFPLVFAFAALISAAAVITSGKSYIHLESSATTLHAGQAFEIDVYANAHVPVNAVDIRLEFPKEQIQITGIDTGASVITLWAKDPYVENNAVILQGGTFRKGFRGDHLIATINARAIESGLAQISVDDVVLLAGDGSGSKVSVSSNDADSTTLYIDAENTQVASDQNESGGVNLQGTASVVIVTDIDGDGAVTLGDISKFMVAWANRSVIYDFNGDGYMSFRDFGIILAESFLQ
jgi:hypothetical protein